MADLKEAVYEDGVIAMPKLNYDIGWKGIGHQYFKSMTRHKDKIFQIDGVTGETDYFGTALQRCVRTALAMRSLGIEPGDIITVCSLNSLDSCVPHIAAFFLGAITAHLDPLIAFSDSIHLIKQINPKIIFVENHSIDHVENLLKTTGKTSKIVVFGDSDRHTNFSEFLKLSPDEETFEPVEVDSTKTAIVLFSSGSTGLPKGICISHEAHLKRSFLNLKLETSFDPYLTFSRLYWSTAVLHLGASILGGHSRLIIPKFDADLVWRVIERFKPRCMFASPFQMATLCGNKDVFDRDASSLQTVYIGGGLVFEQQLLKYRKQFFNANVKLGYGLTELGIVTYSITQTLEQCELLKKNTITIGSALNGLSYKVVDIDSRTVLGPFDIGELLIKSEHQLNGYYNLDSTEAWDSDGWFKTGDIVYYDEEFYFYYVERLKEVIKYQTLHVVPKFIENLLCTHPKVKSACIIGILDEIDGEHPLALVQLRENCSDDGIEKEFYDFVANNLEDKYKLRGGVKIVNQFPMTVSGKIDLIQLKRRFRPS